MESLCLEGDEKNRMTLFCREEEILKGSIVVDTT